MSGQVGLNEETHPRLCSSPIFPKAFSCPEHQVLIREKRTKWAQTAGPPSGPGRASLSSACWLVKGVEPMAPGVFPRGLLLVPGCPPTVQGRPSVHGTTHHPPLTHRYLALYAYKPQKSDELELRKGDTYRVLEKCRDGWFKGTALRTGLSGVFPGNYVTPVSR